MLYEKYSEKTYLFLWKGRVEMEVQGQPLDIQELLKRIQEQNWIEVSDMEITDIPCKQENSFHIY